MSEPEPGTTLLPSTPRLRIVPTPDREPGRELGHVRALDPDLWAPPSSRPSESQGTLALTFLLPSGLTSEPQAPPLRLLRPVPSLARGLSQPETDATADADYEADADFGRQRTRRADLPDPALWAPRFMQAVVDVLAGDRPSQQLLRWTSEDIYAQIRNKARREAQVGVRRRTGRRAAVRSTRVCEPADGIVEACATVRYLDRVRTVAFRLEGTDGRWRCTVLQFG